MHFREKLLLFLGGIFLTSLVLGNVIGTTKFVSIFGLTVPAGVWLLKSKVHEDPDEQVWGYRTFTEEAL